MRLIDGDELYRALSEEAAHRIRHSDNSQFDVGRTNGIICARDIISTMPTIFPPVKRGEWIPVTNGRGGNECSECHDYAPSFQAGHEYLSNYCPSCGCYMQGAGGTEGNE